MSQEYVVTCECGFEARGTRAALITEVAKHGRDVHNMTVTEDQVMAMAVPATGTVSG